MKNYLAYLEVLESSMWTIADSIEKIRENFYFTSRIFEVPSDFTMSDLNSIEKPRYHKIADKFELVYKEGANLIHIKEMPKIEISEILGHTVKLLEDDIWSIHKYLDDLKLPKIDLNNQETYSVVGRIKQLEKRHLKELSDLETLYLGENSLLKKKFYTEDDIKTAFKQGLEEGYHFDGSRSDWEAEGLSDQLAQQYINPTKQ